MGVLDPANIAALDSKDKELLGGLVKLNAEDFECPSGIALPTPPAPEEDEDDDGKRELEMALMQLLKEDIEDGKGPRPSGDGKGPRPGPPGPPKGDDDFFVPTVQPEKREDKKGPKGPKKGPKGQKSSESDEDDDDVDPTGMPEDRSLDFDMSTGEPPRMPKPGKDDM